MSASRSTLTIIVSTSCSRLPELQLVHTLRVLCSLHDFQPAAPIILACDALPTEVELAEAEQQDEQQDVSKWTSTWQHRDAYDAYTAALRAEQARGGRHWQNVQLVMLETWGHLVGTVREAMTLVATPYVLVTQHDLVLDEFAAARAWPAIECALSDGRAHIITCNRDAHACHRSAMYWHHEPALNLRTHGVTLTAVVGFSDQAHFASVAWYRQRVLGAIPHTRRTCMEHVLHEAMCDAYADDAVHARSFLLLDMLEPPLLHDLMHGQLSASNHFIHPPHRDSEWRPFCDSITARPLGAAEAAAG